MIGANCRLGVDAGGFLAIFALEPSCVGQDRVGTEVQRLGDRSQHFDRGVMAPALDLADVGV